MEIVDIPPSEPLQQGDIIRARVPSDQLTRCGLIVTADCDLAWRKHGGRLNYVPVLTTEDYLSLTFLPTHVAAGLVAASSALVDLVARVGRNGPSGHGPRLSVDRATAWVVEAGPAAIADELELSGADRTSVLSIAEIILRAANARGGDFAEQADALSCLSGAGYGETVKQLAGALKNHISKGLPGDAFYMTGGGPLANPSGYVCYLRLIQIVADQDVSTSNSPLLDGAMRDYRRVGRLSSPYIHALTQQLGQVFSSIGMPSIQENLRRERVDQLLSDFTARMGK